MFEFQTLKRVKIAKTQDGKITSAIQGGYIEMIIKYASGIEKWDCISPAGKPDFAIKYRHYDVKQNGSPIEYGGGKAVEGSSRVIYAPFIACELIEDTATYQVWEFDPASTEFFIVDKNAFVKFLRTSPKNLIKPNSTREQVNIQTVYNYSKQAYHGKKGQYIREWCIENEIETDFKDTILEVFYNL